MRGVVKARVMKVTPVLSTIPAIFKGQGRYLSDRGFDVHVAASPDCAVDGWVEREGFSYHPVRILREVAPHRDLGSIRELVRVMRRVKPHIIHTHTSKGGLVGMVAGALARVPHRVHSIAGWSADSRDKVTGSLILLSERLTLRLATQVLVNSASLRDYLIGKGFLKPGGGYMLGKGSSNGVDLSYFTRDESTLSFGRKLRQGWSIADDDVVIAFVGRIMLEKGIRELLDGFLFFGNDPRVHLMIIGSWETGSRKGLAEELTATLKNHPRIHITGWINNVPHHLAAADILVHPSYHEGMPNVLLQAAALGLPCLASDVRGNRDAVVHGETGFLFDLANTKELTDLLSLLVNDRSLRDGLGREGRRYIEREFSMEVVCRRLSDFYYDLINKGS